MFPQGVRVGGSELEDHRGGRGLGAGRPSALRGAVATAHRCLAHPHTRLCAGERASETSGNVARRQGRGHGTHRPSGAPARPNSQRNCTPSVMTDRVKGILERMPA